MPLHLIKLVVGCDTIEDLLARQAANGAPDWRVHTRQTPKQAQALIGGGSIYRVFKGAILCRQTILDVVTVGEGRASRCEIVIDPTIVRVEPTGRRPFQGWRYLKPDEAPGDLDAHGDMVSLPPALALKLREIGAW